jgi:hypothetical protein
MRENVARENSNVYMKLKGDADQNFENDEIFGST